MNDAQAQQCLSTLGITTRSWLGALTRHTGGLLVDDGGCVFTVHYFGPDDLGWHDLAAGYTDWLGAVLAGSLTRFYDTLHWPGWDDEASALRPDQAIHTWPPPWSKEGQDLSTVSRKPVPITELVAFHQETQQQLDQS